MAKTTKSKKQINLTFEGTSYTLEFTRKAIEQMERSGFIVSEVADKPMTNLPTLFAGAFIANHKWVKKDMINKIFDTLKDKQGLIGKLVEMYNEPIEALFNESEEGEENLTEWGASW